jgi:hypothetical protein
MLDYILLATYNLLFIYLFTLYYYEKIKNLKKELSFVSYNSLEPSLSNIIDMESKEETKDIYENIPIYIKSILQNNINEVNTQQLDRLIIIFKDTHNFSEINRHKYLKIGLFMAMINTEMNIDLLYKINDNLIIWEVDPSLYNDLSCKTIELFCDIFNVKSSSKKIIEYFKHYTFDDNDKVKLIREYKELCNRLNVHEIYSDENNFS